MTGLTLIEPLPADLPLAPRRPVLEPAALTFLEAIADLPSLADLGAARTRDAIARIQAAIRELAAGTGAAVVFPHYTHAPQAQYPRAIRESYAVLFWVAFHGAAHGLDGSRIAIAGDSVGATIATALTLLAKERGGPALAAQVLFYPAADASLNTESHRRFARGHWLRRDAMQWFWDQYIPDQARRAERTASPLRASLGELANLPPALILTAEADILRDEGEAYARRLGEAGVNVTTTRYPGILHDFAMLNALRQTKAAEAAISQSRRASGRRLRKAPFAPQTACTAMPCTPSATPTPLRHPDRALVVPSPHSRTARSNRGRSGCVPTLVEQLDVIRLEHRVTRLERVLAALRVRVHDYSAIGIPAGLRSAIRDFDGELAAVRERLAIHRSAENPRVLSTAPVDGLPR
ncbi:MAG: alpha/beta hydrolase [Solirubrobacteraceae bacterium]